MDTSTYELGIKVCEALKLDPSRVISIEIRLKIGTIPSAVIEFYPSDRELQDTCPIFKNYDLTPHED